MDLPFYNPNMQKKDVNHFVILDGVMPIMDGLEVLEEIKKGKMPIDIKY